MPLHRLLYRSEMTLHGAPASIDGEVAAIVDHARKANEKCGVTGAMMCTGNTFVQVLEGTPGGVEETFERICRDARHRQVHLQYFAHVSRRVFDRWRMIAIPRTAAAAAGIDATVLARDALAANAAVLALRRLAETVDPEA